MLDEETRKERIRAAKRRYNERNREKLREAARLKRLENPEEVRRKRREWCAKNKEKIAAIMRKYAEKNPEKIAARKKKWNDANAQRRADWQRDYSKKNKETIAKKKREYRDANPDKARAYNHRRRARLNGDAPPEQLRLAELKVQQIRSSSEVAPCAYCEQYFPTKSLHIDHIVPLYRGGKHSPDNLILACRKCNSSKGTKILLEEWIPPFLRDKKKPHQIAPVRL